MALTTSTPSVMNTIQVAYGTAYDALRDGADTTVTQLAIARDSVHDELDETNIDQALLWIQNLRSAETTAKGNALNLLVAGTKAMETFYVNKYAAKFRTYWKAGVSADWNSNFLELWRLAMSEELILPLASKLNTTGNWANEVGFTVYPLQLDTAMEARLTAGPTLSADITITCTLTKADGSAEIASVLMPIGTTVGTAFPLVSTASSKFKTVTVFNVTGGSNTNKVQIWTR